MILQTRLLALLPLLFATSAAAQTMTGVLDGATPIGLHGWACVQGGANAPVTVALLAGASIIGTTQTLPSSDPAQTAALCHSTTTYGVYWYPLTTAALHQYAGQRITAQAQMPDGTWAQLGNVARLLPVTWSPATWYPYVSVNGVPTPGAGPGDAPGYALQGDFQALFAPGAAWNPGDLDVMSLGPVDISPANPGAPAMARWLAAHPSVGVAVDETMLAVGPKSGCVAPNGVPVTTSSEGLVYSPAYGPGGLYDAPTAGMSGLTYWHGLGGPLTYLGMDIPLSKAFDCSWTVAQTVAVMVPFIQHVQAMWPGVKLGLGQGVYRWTNAQWLANVVALDAALKAAVGTGISKYDFDADMTQATMGNPPVPTYTLLAQAAAAFSAAGIDFAANVDTVWEAGDTQATVTARIVAMEQAIVASGVPFGHVSLQPFSLMHNSAHPVANLGPGGLASALTQTYWVK